MVFGDFWEIEIRMVFDKFEVADSEYDGDFCRSSLFTEIKVILIEKFR